MKFHHYSGNLFSQFCKRRPVQMRLERSGVPVHFERENFCVVALRQQHFELQGTRLIFYARPVRCQRSYDLISMPWRHLDRDDIRKFWHVTISPKRLEEVLLNSFPQTRRPARRYRPVAATPASLIFATA